MINFESEEEKAAYVRRLLETIPEPVLDPSNGYDLYTLAADRSYDIYWVAQDAGSHPIYRCDGELREEVAFDSTGQKREFISRLNIVNL